MGLIKQKLKEPAFWVIPILGLIAIGLKVFDFTRSQSLEWTGPLARLVVYLLAGIFLFFLLSFIKSRWFRWLSFVGASLVVGLLDYYLLGRIHASQFDPTQPANRIIPTTVMFYLVFLVAVYYLSVLLIKAKAKRFYFVSAAILILSIGLGIAFYHPPTAIADGSCPSANIFGIWYEGTQRVSHTAEQENWAKSYCSIFQKNVAAVDNINYWPDGDCPTEKQGNSYILHGKPAVLKAGQQEWINANCDGLTGYKKVTYAPEYPYQNLGTNELKAKAEAALAKGITLNDDANDWVYTRNSDDNPNPYKLDFADIRSLTFASDNDYIYVKAIWGGNFPKSLDDYPVINGDKITGSVINIGLDTDNNSKTGCPANAGAESTIATGYGDGSKGKDVPNAGKELRDGSGYQAKATGIGMPEEDRYAVQGYPIGRWGQPGDNYKILVYKLSDLGLVHGQKVTISASAEAGSKKWHHSSFDPFIPAGATGGDIFHKVIQITI